jgi:type II secretory pathway predicted ATPase ExeA
MPDDQPSFLHNDQELLEVALSIDPRILQYFRLLEHPYRGGPDFRYLYTTDQVQEVLIQSVQLSVSRTGPFTLTGAYGTGKSTIITRVFALLDLQKEFQVKFITLHRGVTKNWLIRKIAEAFEVKPPAPTVKHLKMSNSILPVLTRQQLFRRSFLMMATLWMRNAFRPSTAYSMLRIIR